jgi:hypothetical protein
MTSINTSAVNRPSKRLRIAAAVFIIFNVGGAALAFANAEFLHAMGHITALVVGYGAYLILRRILGSPKPQVQKKELPAANPAVDHIDHIQQSVDAIALNVERIGEAQRFNAKILEERALKRRDDASR